MAGESTAAVRIDELPAPGGHRPGRWPPWLYLRGILVRVLAFWLMLHWGTVALSMAAQLPDPTRVSARASVFIVALVIVMIRLDLGRRRLTALLPNLGVPVSQILVATAGLTALGEYALAMLAR